MNDRFGSLALAVVLLGSGCNRLADLPEEDYDFEVLKRDACLDACDTLDTCDPDRFVGMEPEDCFERCMTLLPDLHEENQCGSREIIHLQCLGGLTCEGFAAFSEGSDLIEGPPDYTAPCVTELHWAPGCSKDEPFELDEPVPSHP